MKLNCKVGDLAVIVRAVLPENVGMFVTVVRGEFETESGQWIWLCESQRPSPGAYNGIRAPNLDVLAWSYDSDLRPIRDQPGNENWVTESRKELNKGKTEITERGEIA